MDERTLARFFSKVNKDGPLSGHCPELGPCWLWKPLGSCNGYGQFTLNGKMRLAHRASYEILVGPIPDGLTIDHLCRVRECVNPRHLEAVTLAENIRRAKVWEHGAAFQRNKTHCASGHPYSGDNLRMTKSGKRACRACERRYSAEHRARELAANPPQPKPPAPPREFCANGHPWAENRVMRGGQGACVECEREKVRRFRERKRAQRPPDAPATECRHGHPWIEANIYINPRTGGRACRTCHNERSLARYYAARDSKTGTEAADAASITLF